jgi:serine/threonine protein kinase
LEIFHVGRLKKCTARLIYFRLVVLFHLQIELQIQGRIQHANIVHVYGGCLQPPTCFVVSELMEGGDLDHYLHRRKRAEESTTFDPPLQVQGAIVNSVSPPQTTHHQPTNIKAQVLTLKQKLCIALDIISGLVSWCK